MDIGEVTVTQDLRLGMFPFEPLEQCKERSLLFDGPGIGRCTLLIEPALVAYAQRSAVVTPGMGTDELLVACLGDGAVACDVVVVACEPEAVGVVADQLHHAITPVATGGGAVHYNHVYTTHGLHTTGYTECCGDGRQHADAGLDDELQKHFILLFHIYYELFFF